MRVACRAEGGDGQNCGQQQIGQEFEPGPLRGRVRSADSDKSPLGRHSSWAVNPAKALPVMLRFKRRCSRASFVPRTGDSVMSVAVLPHSAHGGTFRPIQLRRPVGRRNSATSGTMAAANPSAETEDDERPWPQRIDQDPGLWGGHGGRHRARADFQACGRHQAAARRGGVRHGDGHRTLLRHRAVRPGVRLLAGPAEIRQLDGGVPRNADLQRADRGVSRLSGHRRASGRSAAVAGCRRACGDYGAAGPFDAPRAAGRRDVEE